MLTDGFAALADFIGARMGQPTECPHADDKGNIAQRTTSGVATYLAGDNLLTFTIGWNADRLQSWALFPDGLHYLYEDRGSGTTVRLPAFSDADCASTPADASDPDTLSTYCARVDADAAANTATTPTPASSLTTPDAAVPAERTVPVPAPAASLVPAIPALPARPMPPVALHAWAVPSGGSLQVDPRLDEVLNDLWTWDVGRALIADGANQGVRIWIETMPEPSGSRVFGDYTPVNRDIRINAGEMWGATSWVVAGTLAHELAHASDDLHGVPMAISTKACYQTEIHAFGTMIDWDTFARGHYGRATGPMVAELWALGAEWKLGNVFGYDQSGALIIDSILHDYGESCGSRPLPWGLPAALSDLQRAGDQCRVSGRTHGGAVLQSARPSI